MTAAATVPRVLKHPPRGAADADPCSRGLSQKQQLQQQQQEQHQAAQAEALGQERSWRHFLGGCLSIKRDKSIFLGFSHSIAFVSLNKLKGFW